MFGSGILKMVCFMSSLYTMRCVVNIRSITTNAKCLLMLPYILISTLIVWFVGGKHLPEEWVGGWVIVSWLTDYSTEIGPFQARCNPLSTALLHNCTIGVEYQLTAQNPPPSSLYMSTSYVQKVNASIPRISKSKEQVNSLQCSLQLNHSLLCAVHSVSY